MATTGLTREGYIPMTGGEWFNYAKAEFDSICAELGITPPNYQRHEFVTVLLRIASQMASEVEDGVGTLFDLHDPNQASGALLETIARLTGTPFETGTRSTVTLTVGAWARGNVTLPIGTDASDGTYTWRTIEDVTIAAGATASVVAEVTEDGPIDADNASITQRVTSIAGWTSVTNAAGPTLGTLAESDSVIRERVLRGAGSLGSRSPSAVRAALEKVSGVIKAVVVFNATDVAVTVSTRSIPKYGCGVWVYPDDLVEDSQKQVLSILYSMLPANVTRSLPVTTGATGIRGAIAGSDGRNHVEGAWYMVETAVRTRISISLATGYEAGGTLDTVTDNVIRAVEVYFSGLGPGDAVRRDDITGRVAAVEGVARTTVEFQISPFSVWISTDIATDQASFARLDTSTATPVTVVETA